MNFGVSKWIALGLLAGLLGGCAISPQSPEGQALHESFRQAQRKTHELRAAEPKTRPQLFVLAAGLSDETKAFRGDVQGVVERFSTLRPDSYTWTLWNPVQGEKPQAPFATRDALRQSISEIAARAQPGDRVLVMLTSHGHVDLLANVAANHRYSPIRGAELQDMLKPLTPWETGVVISACYSGSLIPALRHPKRWIMTAAAADRSSWGCQFQAKQTYFVDALLKSFSDPGLGLDAWYAQASDIVRRGEEAEKLKPSLPQLWVGSAVQTYRQSLRDFWMVP